jgi:hypothetical protein
MIFRAPPFSRAISTLSSSKTMIERLWDHTGVGDSVDGSWSDPDGVARQRLVGRDAVHHDLDGVRASAGRRLLVIWREGRSANVA